MTLRNTDEEFKGKVQWAAWASKLKVIANELFDFNKKLVEEVQATNVEDMKNKAIAWFTKEADLLEEKLVTRESEYTQWSDEKLPIYLMWLEQHFGKFEKKALRRIDKLDSDYDLATKLDTFTARLEQAKKMLPNQKLES